MKSSTKLDSLINMQKLKKANLCKFIKSGIIEEPEIDLDNRGAYLKQKAK